MASYLQVENISKSYGDKVLFQNISFNINEGDKIALIAPNGTGKSSLLKILAGLDSSDRGGEVKFMKDIKVAFLDQINNFNPQNTLFDEVYSRGLKIMDLTAFTLCKENRCPIMVFDMDTAGNLQKLLSGEMIGTLVHN